MPDIFKELEDDDPFLFGGKEEDIPDSHLSLDPEDVKKDLKGYYRGLCGYRSKDSIEFTTIWNKLQVTCRACKIVVKTHPMNKLPYSNINLELVKRLYEKQFPESQEA